MTATTEILVVCDGLRGQGCPFFTQTRVQTDYKANARKALVHQGWTHMRLLNTTHNVRNLDVCGLCTSAARHTKERKK